MPRQRRSLDRTPHPLTRYGQHAPTITSLCPIAPVRPARPTTAIHFAARRCPARLSPPLGAGSRVEAKELLDEKLGLGLKPGGVDDVGGDIEHIVTRRRATLAGQQQDVISVAVDTSCLDLECEKVAR